MKIAFWGNFGTQNFGNECTLAAIIYNFRQRIPNAQLNVIGVVPADIAVRHQIDALSMWQAPATSSDLTGQSAFARARGRFSRQLSEWCRSFRACRNLDALIVPGTGVLTDSSEGPFGLPFHLFRWSLMARLRGASVMFASVGAERIAHPLSRFFIRSALRLARYRSLRDPHALELIRAIGFSAPIQIAPDLAFSLPRHAQIEPPSPRPRPVVGLGLYHYQNRGSGGEAAKLAYQGYLDRLCTFVTWLDGNGYAVRVIIGDKAYDMDVRDDLRDQLRQRGFDLKQAYYADEPANSYEEIIGQLESVDWLIASRFHNILLALLLGRPVVSLSYEGKIDALMQDMGLGEFRQDIDAFNVDTLIEQFVQLERQTDVLRGVLAKRAQLNRDKLDRQYALMTTDIERRRHRQRHE